MSKFDKLLERITSLSKDMRFDELRKVLKVMVILCVRPKAAAAITHSENQARCQSPFPSMNRSKRYTSRWSKK